MSHLRRLGIVAVCFSALLFLLWLLPRLLNPTPPNREERLRDQRWVDTSPYWIDRQACRWLTLCGIHHVRWDAPALPENSTRDGDDLRRIDLRKRGPRDPGRLSRSSGWQVVETSSPKYRRGPKIADSKAIPEYVLKYAPLVHLYSGENFWPADIAEHVKHMTPFSNGSALNWSRPLDLANLGRLNGESLPVYLTSDENVEDRPEWLHSRVGQPIAFDSDGETGGPGQDENLQERLPESAPPNGGTTWWDVDRDHPLHRISDPRTMSRRRRGGRGRPIIMSRAQHPLVSSTPMYKPDREGYSKAPAVLILVDKGSGILDAFWFFFYSYNLGQTVAHIRFGNHIGDWEHCMVRFENGVPRALFMSEHAGGQAYAWSALEKYQNRSSSRDAREPAQRPVIYSAVGSHAMYATPGNHPYVLPFGSLKDVTDRGPIWDPAKNTYAYFYDYEAGRTDEGVSPTSLVPAASNPDAPTSWFHFAGPWGDELYALSDERQWRLFGQYHYITGPLGPKFKNLDRKKVCQTPRCKILYSIEAGRKAAWYS